MTYNAEKNLTPLYIGKKILRTFSFIFILLLAPEEGLLFCLETEILGSLFRYIFFVLFFCLLLHRLAVRISLPLHIFLQTILTQTKSPIPHSPQKANGQPLRGWGEKRILNL